MKALLIALSLFATSAFAAVIGPDQVQNQGQAQGQIQGQAQGQLQGQAQAATAVSGAAAGASVVSGISNDTRAAGLAQANNGGNSLTINQAPIPAVTSTMATTRIENSDYTIKNVPNVLTGSIYPTAPCMGSSTVGGAGVGFGVSIGSSWTDDECGIRETSRSFNGLGMKDDALKVLCTSKYAAAAPSCAVGVAPR